MAVQADSTTGFVGEVSTARLPQMLSQLARYSVESAGALKVTIGGAGDRAFTVAAGSDWADGVLATWNGSTVMNAAAGTRWNTLVRRTDWTTETATLTLLQGGTERALAAGVQLRNPTPSTGAGFTYSDRPIALIRTTAGQTAVQEVVDLRCWGSDGGLLAMDVAALQYLTDVGTQVRIGDTLYTRMFNGSGSVVWDEKSLAPYEKVPAFGTSEGGTVWSTTGLGSYLIRDGKRRTMLLEQRRSGGGTLTPTSSAGNLSNDIVFKLTQAQDRPVSDIPLTVTYVTGDGGGDYVGSGYITEFGNVVLGSLLPGGKIEQRASGWSVRYYGSWYVA